MAVDEVFRHGEIVPDNFFTIFSFEMQEKQRIFFSKSPKVMWKLTIFPTEINFLAYFLFFLPTFAKRLILIFIFFPPMEQTNPCQTLSTKQYTADALKS